MITLGNSYTIEEVEDKSSLNVDSIDPDTLDKAVEIRYASNTVARPEVVEAKVYKVKSPCVKFSVYITMSYIWENNRKRPVEIFINSKDLTRSAEYAVLTRLISAIFRKTNNPHFILEELRSIYDPNGGFFKDGKYVHSFYAEVADVIERFFEEEGITAPKNDPEQLHIPINTTVKTKAPSTPSSTTISSGPGSVSVSSGSASQTSSASAALHASAPAAAKSKSVDLNANFKICPECNGKTLKTENGCDFCVQCGYTKCDK